MKKLLLIGVVGLFLSANLWASDRSLSSISSSDDSVDINMLLGVEDSAEYEKQLSDEEIHPQELVSNKPKPELRDDHDITQILRDAGYDVGDDLGDDDLPIWPVSYAELVVQDSDAACV